MSLPGFEELVRQAQDFQQRLQKIKDDLAQRTVETSVGGGMVRVTASGSGRITNIELEPKLVDPKEIEMLQDLMVAAVNQAIEAAHQMSSEAIRALTGGLPIPPGLESFLS
jgi:DNA-binding YbaB/EbfC family protein